MLSSGLLICVTHMHRHAHTHTHSSNSPFFAVSQSDPRIFRDVFGRKIAQMGQMSSWMKNVIPGWFCHVLFYDVFVIYKICVTEMNVICETR